MTSHDAGNGSSGATPHRLPTVSATQALRQLKNVEEAAVPFGLPALDALIHGGLRGGQLVEIFGPPGVGKTTSCIQVVCNVLLRKQRVLWVDGCSPIVGPRLVQILDSKLDQTEEERSTLIHELLSNFSKVFVPTLAHFLALLEHQLSSKTEKSGLIVVDSISTLLDSATFIGGDGRKRGQNEEHQRWLDRRRPAMIIEVASRLSKLAALRNAPILVNSNMISKGTLQPALYGREWEQALFMRLCLFRDWPSKLNKSRRRTGSKREMPTRFLSIVKLTDAAVSSQALKQCIIAFDITEEGVIERPDEVELDDGPPQFNDSRAGEKRKVEAITISDDEYDESYGLDDDDSVIAEEELVKDFASTQTGEP